MKLPDVSLAQRAMSFPQTFQGLPGGLFAS
jgi:hypothetical protein